jgi:diaminopimelate decarboxylase
LKNRKDVKNERQIRSLKRSRSAENGHLCFAGIDTVELAEKYGTPRFSSTKSRARAVPRVRFGNEKIFSRGFVPLFASKALSFKEIYRVAVRRDGHDIVSPGRALYRRTAGFDMSRAFFH